MKLLTLKMYDRALPTGSTAYWQNNAVICLPTSPVPAPLRNRSVIEAQDVRTTIVRLTCIAGLTGCPQISLPLGEYDGAPVGLSLIGSRGSDMMLIDFAQQIASLMGKN